MKALRKFFGDPPHVNGGVIAFILTAALLLAVILVDRNYVPASTSSEMMRGMLPPTEEELLLTFIRGKGCTIRKIDIVGSRVEVVLICREEAKQ